MWKVCVCVLCVHVCECSHCMCVQVFMHACINMSTCEKDLGEGCDHTPDALLITLMANSQINAPVRCIQSDLLLCHLLNPV